MSAETLGTYLSLAQDAARAAGRFLLQAGATGGVVADLPRDLKLAADRDAEERIVKVLRQHSDFPMLTEEQGLLAGRGGSAELRWIIDPLDGSINFWQGIPFCCVSVALWRGPEPLLGVIYDFHREEMFYGRVDAGAWLNGNPILPSATSEVGKAILCTGFPAGGDFAPESLLGLVEQLRRYRKVRLLGSAALSLAYVAAGRADAYFERDIKIWDVAAGLALVQAAGGVAAVTDSPVADAVTVYAGNPWLEQLPTTR